MEFDSSTISGIVITERNQQAREIEAERRSQLEEEARQREREEYKRQLTEAYLRPSNVISRMVKGRIHEAGNAQQEQLGGGIYRINENFALRPPQATFAGAKVSLCVNGQYRMRANATEVIEIEWPVTLSLSIYRDDIETMHALAVLEPPQFDTDGLAANHGLYKPGIITKRMPSEAGGPVGSELIGQDLEFVIGLIDEADQLNVVAPDQMTTL